MSLLGWFRDLLRPRPPTPAYELRHVMAIREMYVAQVQSTANLAAAIRSLDLQIGEHRSTVARWERRKRLPLSADLRASAVGIHARYASYLASALAVRSDCARSLAVCEHAQESMLRHLTHVGGVAARSGIDTRPLAVEIDVAAVQQTAAERNARALIEEGICETDEERDFLERLFDRGLESRDSSALS